MREFIADGNVLFSVAGQTMQRPRTMENQQVSRTAVMQPRPQSPERGAGSASSALPTRFRMVQQADGTEVAVAL